MSSSINLKPGWRLVRFGDVVHQIKDRVDWKSSGLTEYIRGEHFEPGSLRLIGRSQLGDGQHGPSFNMRFREGDVLYVSRNPQLRKAAIADIKGIQITRQGHRIYSDKLLRRVDPRDQPYFWIGGDPPSGIMEEGTDFYAISNGYVSITPLKLDLTDFDKIDTLRSMDWTADDSE